MASPLRDKSEAMVRPERGARFLLALLVALSWLGWIVVVWGGPFAWIVYAWLQSELRQLRKDFRTVTAGDPAEWALAHQTPGRPRLAVNAADGTQDLGDTGHQDLGYTRRSRSLNAALYPARWECPSCHAQYEEGPDLESVRDARACSYCGTHPADFDPVVTLVSRAP